MATGGAAESAAAARPPGLVPLGASRAAAAPASDVHHDIARGIGQQVEAMIMEAKYQSESKVGKEVQKINVKLESVSDKIKATTARVSRIEGNGNSLLKADLNNNIAKLEEVWESEVATLKHELWQTIQAHNHNADLLKHHKDAIDGVTARLEDSEAGSSPEMDQVQALVLQSEKVLQREQHKDQQSEQLKTRLAVVTQQWAALTAGSWNPASLAVAGGYTMPQGLPNSAAVAAAAAKKGARGKASAKGKAKAPAAASAQAAAAAANLRAEAPEFVPTFSMD